MAVWGGICADVELYLMGQSVKIDKMYEWDIMDAVVHAIAFGDQTLCWASEEASEAITPPIT